MTAPIDPRFVWTCPKCGRSVPRRVSSCRCGYTQPPAEAPAPPPPAPVTVTPAPPSRGVSPVVLMIVGGIAIAATSGAIVLWLTQRSAAPAQQSPAAALTTSRPVSPGAGALPDAPPSRPADLPAGLPAQPVSFQPAETSAPLSVEDLVAKSMPAVVMIEAREGTGSGFFVSADTVLTNAHVVQSNAIVTLVSSTGGRTRAHVDSTISNYDLAVVKADVANPAQVTLALAQSSDIHVGAEVIAIGAPLGLQNTVTRGIVSGTRVADGVRLVQTDAAINPGNSGGPLIDRYGRVLGVNTLKVAGGGTESIGFAVSVEYVRRVLGPEFAPKSARDQQREDGLRQYEQDIAALAQRLDEVDRNWPAFAAECYGRPRTSLKREWFALWDGQMAGVKPETRCRTWAAYFQDWAKRTHDSLDRYEGNARLAAVTAATTQGIRRKYNMYWPAWE